MSDSALKQPMAHFQSLSKELLITIAGAITSLTVAAANTWLLRSSGFDLLSFSIWFVLPVGAMGGGMLAASGYYLAARLTHTMPSRRFLLEMLAIGASTWLLAQWMVYDSLTLSDGSRVRDYAGFWEYFQLQAEHMKLSFGTRGNVNAVTTDELGGLGYVREALQLLGFMFGGLAIYVSLSNIERCDACRKYARKKVLLSSATPEEFQKLLSDSGLPLPGLVDEARATLGERRLVGFSFALLQCPECKRQWCRPAVVVQSGNSPDERPLSHYTLTTDQATELLAVSTSNK
jgi:hypothetical protein